MIAPRDAFNSSIFHVRINDHGRISCMGSNLDQEARLGLACMSDLFLGALLFAAVQTTALDAQICISEYLPELRYINQRVPIHHLASHSTGYLPPCVEFQNIDDLMGWFSAHTPAFSAGETVDYTRLEAGLLTAILERVLGDSIEHLLERWLFAPAGIGGSWSISRSPTGIPRMDMSLVQVELLAQYIKSPDFFDGRLADALQSRTATIDITRHVLSPTHPVAYGWGLALFRSGMWGVNGFSSQHPVGLRFDIASSFVMTAAVQEQPALRDLILDQMGRRHRPASTLRQAGAGWGSVRGLDAQDLPGRYTGSEENVVNVTLASDRLDFELCGRGREPTRFSTRLDQDTIVGDLKWSLRGEFFPHLQTKRPCLVLGIKSFVKEEP